MEGAVGIVAVIFLQALAQIARGKGLAGSPDGITQIGSLTACAASVTTARSGSGSTRRS